MRQLVAIAFTTLTVLFCAGAAHAGPFPDAADGTFEYVAVRSGAWHSDSTWSGTGIPGPGDDVLVPATCNGSACLVTVQRVEPDAIRYLKVDGEFRLWIHSDTKLEVETIYVASGATFRIGAGGPNHVGSAFKAEVVFTGSGALDTVWDPKQMTRGLVSDGAIRWYGEPKKHMAAKSSDALAGATSVTVDLLPGDWEVGDEVVLTGSHFDRYTSPTSSQDEVRTINGFVANGYSFVKDLEHDHRRAAPNMDLHVANLTRNLVFRSASTSPIANRGHIMLRSGDVIIHNASFEGLGRTNKAVPLNDLIVTLEPNSTNPTSFEVVEPSTPPSNPRGRYSLHFHQNGVANPAGPPASTVHGSVVRDAAGWGFVNHSSHVDFQRNVAYDFVGAGFVTESGDELGNFFENIAIRGRGDGVFDPIFRFVFNNAQRPQPLSDFGFRGDGFWFQGPAIRVRDNVASGCDSAGMVWFTTGAPLPTAFYTDTDGYQKNKYSHFPRAWIDMVYGAGTAASLNPRHWQRPGETGTDRIVVVDLPILEMDGFEAYGNYVGFRLRFNNSNSVAWYNDLSFDYHLDIQSSGAVDRRTQRIDNLKLWNNQQAFRMRYADRTDWSGVEAINRLAYDEPSSNQSVEWAAGHSGAELFHELHDHRFLDSLIIQGYPVAGQIQNGITEERAEFIFNGQKYEGFANADEWHSGISCTRPTNPIATSTLTTRASLSWTSTSPRHAVRYRPVGEQLWTYRGPNAGNTVTLTGLTPNTNYEFQVVAGCAKTIAAGTFDTLSRWSVVGTFSTP